MNAILENLEKAILTYDKKRAEEFAKKAVAEGTDLMEAVKVLTKAIKEIGDAFGRGDCFLPELVGGGTALQSAMTIIEGEFKRQGKRRESLGRVVIGTVLGDIHNIGKNLVGSLLVANGFEVIDLDVNVAAERFLSAVKEHNPDILAMSALMTTTAAEMSKVIKNIESSGLRDKVKIMVGGGAITQSFSEEIMADGTSPTAPGAVELAMKLMNR
jgi:5-methyltetrahydrofolate--homocysteine methyltransferase